MINFWNIKHVFFLSERGRKLVSLGAAALFAVSFQAAAITQISVEPSSPSAYEPFMLRLTFSTPVCFSTSSPVYANVSFRASTLSMSLSHLKPGPCVTERLLPVSGLPAGTNEIRVNITSAKLSTNGDGFVGGSTVETEVARTQVTVLQSPQLESVNLYSARVDGDNVFKPFDATEGGGGPVVLWQNHGDPLTGGGDWLDVGSPLQDGYTFKAARRNAALPAQLPSVYEPLYLFRYPAPLQGVFAATTTEFLPIVRAWLALPSAAVCPTPVYYVLKYKNGACPMGATPVFRLFHPQSVVHRYTQSMDTYSELQNHGFIGEGPVFCAPGRS